VGICRTDWASFTCGEWATSRADCQEVFGLINRAALEFSLPAPAPSALAGIRAGGSTPPILLFRHICRPSEVNAAGLPAALARAASSLGSARAALALVDGFGDGGRFAHPLGRDPGERISLMLDQLRDGFERAGPSMDVVARYCHSDVDDAVFVGRVFDVVEEPFYEVCALFPRYLEILERADYAIRCLASVADTAMA